MKLVLILITVTLCLLNFNWPQTSSFNPKITSQPNQSSYFLKPTSNGEPQFHLQELAHKKWGNIHSSNIIRLYNGDLLVSWFAGTREGHRDVQIYSQRYVQSSKTWQPIQSIISSQQASDELNLYVKKVGNAVITELAPNHLMMIYVSVSIGGWATSQLNSKQSFDGGKSWQPSRRLVNSALFNISFLVRSKGIIDNQQQLLLPIYFELDDTYSALLALNNQGQVQWQKKIAFASDTLAPVFTIKNNEQLTMHARVTPAGKMASSTLSFAKSGLSIFKHDSHYIELQNPKSSMDIVRIRPDLWLMAYNPMDTERSKLALAVSDNQGKDWQFKRYLPYEKGKKYSYPSLLHISQDSILLSYSDNRDNISIAEFNLAWLEQ